MFAHRLAVVRGSILTGMTHAKNIPSAPCTSVGGLVLGFSDPDSDLSYCHANCLNDCPDLKIKWRWIQGDSVRFWGTSLSESWVLIIALHLLWDVWLGRNHGHLKCVTVPTGDALTVSPNMWQNNMRKRRRRTDRTHESSSQQGRCYTMGSKGDRANVIDMRRGNGIKGMPRIRALSGTKIDPD